MSEKRDIHADGFVAGHAVGLAGFSNLPENPHPLHTPDRHAWAIAYGKGRSLGQLHRQQMEMVARGQEPAYNPLGYTIYGKRVGIGLPPSPDLTVEELDQLIWNLMQIRIAIT